MVRAAAAGAVLAVLVAGVPAALAHYLGWPLPRHMSWPQLRQVLAAPLASAVILKVLACVVWVAWVMFTLSAVAEIAAHLRGRAARRLPVLAGLQAVTAVLVSAATAAGAAGVSAAAPAGFPHAAVALAATPLSSPLPAGGHAASSWPAHCVPQRGSGPGRGAALAARRHARAGRAVYRVVAGDDLWGIAARRLGDGQRWHQIYALNRGRPQPGGGALTHPSLLYPGWILLLPPPPSAQHAHRPDRPATRPEPARHRGDGSHPRPGQARHRAGRHRRPATAPRPAKPAQGGHLGGVRLPGGGVAGITLAAAISAAVVTWRLHRRRTAALRWPVPGHRPDPPLPAPVSALHRAHLDSVATRPTEPPNPPWPGTRPTARRPHHEQEPDKDGLDEFGAPTGPTAPPPGIPDSRPGRSLPTARRPGATAGRAARAPLAAPVPAPEDPAGTSPGIAASRLLPGGHRPPPARALSPGTVVLGTRGGTEVPLLPLAGHGLGLTGPGAHATARALLVGLLAAPTSTRQPPVQVIIPAADARLLGIGHAQAAELIPGVTPGLPDGLIITPTLATALDRAETELHRRPQQPTGIGIPQLALISTADPETAARAAAIARTGGLVGVFLGPWPAGTTCHIDGSGHITAATGPALAGITACHLTAADTAVLLALLRGAQGHITPDQPPRPPTPPPPPPTPQPPPAPQQAHPQQGAQQTAGAPAASPPPAAAASPPRPDAPVTSTTAAGTTAAAGRPVIISVLGPLRITTSHNGEIRGGLRKARELLAYLAVHPGGVTGEGISAGLWPESGPRYAAGQRKLALRKAREMLRTATGLPTPMFIILTADRYRLDPTLIAADLWQFDTALAAAQQASNARDQLTALQQAAALYQGPLADGAGYEWAERHAEPARRRAVDALARIAALLQPHSPEQALTVLETALDHDPYNEALYQQIMRIQARLGRPDAAHRTLALLQARLAELGQAPAPATRHPAGLPPSGRPGTPVPPPPHGQRPPRGTAPGA